MDGIIRFTGCGYDTMRSEDDYKIDGTQYVSIPKFRKPQYKSIFGQWHDIEPRELKRLYWEWQKGATACENKPKTFYKYHIKNITYDEFLDIIY